LQAITTCCISKSTRYRIASSLPTNGRQHTVERQATHSQPKPKRKKKKHAKL
jgi:hypothetical protein